MFGLQSLRRINRLVFSPTVKSGDEVYYEYVQSGCTYSFESYDSSAMFVLPPDPEPNCTIHFSDHRGSNLWYPVRIHRNGHLIMGEKDHLSCDVPNVMFKMIYTGGTIGWIVMPDNQYNVCPNMFMPR